MLLDVRGLIEKKRAALGRERLRVSCQPGLALIWVGDDRQTAVFVRAKQRLARELDCKFFLHRFGSGVTVKQVEATVRSLNANENINGIVLQLPLPRHLDIDYLISQIHPSKDVDGLLTNSKYLPPTAKGIVEIILYCRLDPTRQRTVIVGGGRLVGAPLTRMFDANGWPYTLITKNAADQTELIRSHDILISATGVTGLVVSSMVHKTMTVIDGSGVDVNVAEIEPLVKAVTPRRGAIGPLTVINLFQNLLRSSKLT